MEKEHITDEDIINIAYRKEKLKEFKKNLEDKDFNEGKWQVFFKKNEWIFGFNLDYQYLNIIKREQSLGDGKGNNPRTDYLCEINNFTLLIELKTHETELFGNSTNRSGAWKLSTNLMDAFSQILEQKAEWQIKGEKENIKQRTRDPKAILIIGNKKKELLEEEDELIRKTKNDTFELFRRDSRNIEIITFDELYERAKYILEKNEKKS